MENLGTFVIFEVNLRLFSVKNSHYLFGNAYWTTNLVPCWSFSIVAPVTAQEIVSNLQITGISMLGKTVFPSTDNFLTNLPGLYPRYTQARLLHAPAQCDDETLTELLHLPADTTIIGFKRQTDTNDGMSFFNGK